MLNAATIKNIETLRSQMSAMQTIDPTTQAYQNLISFLNGLDQDHLKVLALANIKFLSRLAMNRIVKN